MLKLSELRKRTHQLKYRRIAARVTEAEHALIQQAADLQGQSVTGFVLSTVQKEAMQIIETMEAVRSSASHAGAPLKAARDEGEHPRPVKRSNLKTSRSK